MKEDNLIPLGSINGEFYSAMIVDDTTTPQFLGGLSPDGVNRVPADSVFGRLPLAKRLCLDCILTNPTFMMIM